MPQFQVRQRMIYYEDYELEAASAEEAISLVNSGEINSRRGPEYIETINTYILDDEGVYMAKEQPENATPLTGA